MLLLQFTRTLRRHNRLDYKSGHGRLIFRSLTVNFVHGGSSGHAVEHAGSLIFASLTF